MRKVLVLIFILFFSNLTAFGDDTGVFDLSKVADYFINTDTSNNKIDNLSKTAFQNHKQGNIQTSVQNYSDILSHLSNDFQLLSFAKFMYREGYFSLADSAIHKIKYKENLKSQIEDLKKTYSMLYVPDLQEEIYLLKAKNSIIYNGQMDEVAYDINKNKELLKKSDYAYYVLSLSQIYLKQYKNALFYIENAISKNPENVHYAYLKAKILSLKKDYKTSNKYISKLRKKNFITMNIKNDFDVLYLLNLKNLEKSQIKKSEYDVIIAYKMFDFYKCISIATDILSQDKENVVALYYLAKSNSAILNISDMKKYAEILSKISPDSIFSDEVSGDVSFVDFKYNLALDYYKKAYKHDKNNVVILNKIILVKNILNEKDKKLEKYLKISDKLNNNPTFELYEIKKCLLPYLNKDSLLLQKDYLKKSIVYYPLNINAWLDVAENELNVNKNIGFAKNILDAIYLGHNEDYRYFYIKSLILYNENKPNEAIQELNYSIKLNKFYEPSSSLLNSIDSSL